MLNVLLNRFKDFSPSELSHHAKPCCRQARSWFLAMDLSLRKQSSSPPVWIRNRYEWGPCRWPLYWCEVIRSHSLDCGALAALAREAWRARDISVFPCQLIQHVDRWTVAHRRSVWEKAGCSPEWAVGDLFYHEACAILRNGVLALWDPTVNITIEHSPRGTYGRVVAIKICQPAYAHAHAPDSLRWSTVDVPHGRWVKIDGESTLSTSR